MERVRIYVINLDRSPDRLAFMSEQLDRLPIPWQRVSAIDGKTLGPPQPDVIDVAAYMRSHGKPVNMNRVGCYLSNVKVMQQFLESDAEFAVILQDDVVLGADFAGLIGALIDDCALWDMVKLAAFHNPLTIAVRTYDGGAKLASMLTRTTSAAAYLVNRHAAERYVEKLLPMHVPFDHAFDRAWYFGFRLFGVLPFPAKSQSAGVSTITGVEGHSPDKKFPWWQRSTVLAYRTRNEVSRFVYFTWHGLRARFG